MARFEQGNLRFKTNQEISFDTAETITLKCDGSELGFNSTVSGVTPTEDYHLATKAYADTISGTTDHTELTNIGNNTHTQLDSHLSSAHVSGGDVHDHTGGAGAQIDHADLSNIGGNTHSGIDAHINDSDIHFNEASIDHANITNTHNLTTDIDHDALTNFASNEHFTWNSVSGTTDHNTIVNTHNLTTDIDHDQLTNFESNEHYTEASIDKYTQDEVDALIAASSSGTGQTGQYDISNAVSSFTISFATNFNDTDYNPIGSLENTVDGDVAKYGWGITGTTVSGFTVQLSDITDSGNYKFNWRAGEMLMDSDHTHSLNPTPSTDHSASGDIAPMTVGENVAFGDALYMKSDGKLWKTDADSSTTVPCIALAIATVSADASGDVLMSGFARDDTWTWTAGDIINVSTTAGGLSTTVLSSTGQQVQRVAVATHADRIWFNPDIAVVEVA